jgi:MSHA biogenesis protein MshK
VFKHSYIAIGLVLSLSVFVQAQEAAIDPTKPLGFSGTADASGDAANSDGGIKLTSILISSERKVAIINGQVLTENQTLKGAGALVKKIEVDAVTLQQNGKVWRVALNNTVIRK